MTPIEKLGQYNLLEMAELLKVYANSKKVPNTWEEEDINLDYDPNLGKAIITNDLGQILILKDEQISMYYIPPCEAIPGTIDELIDDFYNAELKNLDNCFTKFNIEKLKMWKKEDVEFILSDIFEDVYETKKFKEDPEFQDNVHRIKIYLIDKIMGEKGNNTLSKLQKEILKLIIDDVKNNLTRGEILDKERILNELYWYANENGFSGGGLAAFKGLDSIERFTKNNFKDIKQNIQEYKDVLNISLEDLLFEDQHYSASIIFQICAFETSKIIEKI